jgi:lipoteichoic acid synthase
MLATPGCYLMLASLAGTLAVKTVALGVISEVHGWRDASAVMAPDCTFFGGLAALFFFADQLAKKRLAPALSWLVSGLAAIVAVLSALNAAYLSVAGEQLTASALVMGLQRVDDAWGILLEELRLHAIALALALTMLCVIPWLASVGLRRPSPWPVASAAATGAPLLVITLLAASIWLLVPVPPTPAVASLANNALVTTYLGWARGALFDELRPDPNKPVDLGPLARPEVPQDLRRRFNVVMLVVESLRFDMAGLGVQAGTRMPRLAELAQRGAWSDAAYTPLPHTTKALFGIHCGRQPFWQWRAHELSSLVRVECLGDVLSSAGYETAFLQSAIGAFEDRPRLVRQLGFARFEAWENIGGEPLGYLSSDDLSLAPALDRWLDGLPADKPFLATLMTSATHHPYRLPNPIRAQLAKSGSDPDALPAEERYGLLVERADQLLGAVLDGLARRGLSERTIVVVMGDHGEGFGKKGARQHDNNFYEEGLRVPLVIAGPGVTPEHMTWPVSLLDVAPTLVELLGFDSALPTDDSLFGRNALEPRDAARTRYFSCYFDARCYGLVRGSRKLVIFPELERGMAFDLSTDPDEESPQELRAKDPELQRLRQLIPTRRFSAQRPQLSALQSDNGWSCPENRSCRHPRTPPDLFFTPSDPRSCVQISRGKPPGDKPGEELTLHNLCLKATVCQLKAGAGGSIELRPTEEKTIAAQGAFEPNAELLADCRFVR